jgi:hypothetical protein
MNFPIATVKLKLPTKMLSAPLKTTQQAERDTQTRARAISLLDNGLSTSEAAKRTRILQSTVVG